jgi:hypothetical protein
MFNLLGLLDQLAILVDAILRNIDSKVRIAGRDHRPRAPGLIDLKDRAQFRVPHAELKEIQGVFTGQND